MPVVDASVIVEFVAFGERREAAERRLREDDEALWAPHLLDAEVGHALRRAVRHAALDPATAGEALWRLDELPLRRVSHEVLVHYAWELRENVSFYDGLYVALAEILDEPLITFDARLARAGVSARVEVLAA
ncbi:MAG TPA: type II toxin-antitoxin system VapC family toxin [Solirubrobacterales bacterium]|jgi:predicted nucleic acid-binding protein|nr:type II toxin-antitoxin system VapC family toxin [Solirubrobacterales bacterium]